MGNDLREKLPEETPQAAPLTHRCSWEDPSFTSWGLSVLICKKKDWTTLLVLRGSPSGSL